MGTLFFFEEEVLIDKSQSNKILLNKATLELLEFDNQVRLRILDNSDNIFGDVVFTKKQCEKFIEQFESAYSRCEKVYNNP